MVTMRPVDSSWVRAIGYDEAAKELWAEFDRSPDPYVYFEVPPEVYRELEGAESKGEFINLMIKPRYKFEHRRLPLATPKRRRG